MTNLDTVTERAPTRYDRQSSFLPLEKLEQIAIIVVGVGALGRPTACLAASTGFGSVSIIDDDTVELPNLAAQGYKHKDLGKAKVSALLEELEELNPDPNYHAAESRLNKTNTFDGICEASEVNPTPIHNRKVVVISCVDSIEVRKMLWNEVKDMPQVSLFLDGRMAGPVIQTYSVPLSDGDQLGGVRTRDWYIDKYNQSLNFTSDEAFEAPCTARSLLYPCYIAAGLLIGQVSNWMRGLQVDPMISCNLNQPSAMSLE